MEIVIEKSKIPIIWLDTSIYINMAKAMDGGRISEIDKHRSLNLYDTIYRKVREKKLICPLGDQREEIEIGGKHIEKCYEIQTQLSLGITFSHRKSIEDKQFYLAMSAFIKNEERVCLKYTSAFRDDPAGTIMKNKQFIVDSVFLPSSEQIARTKHKKRIMLEVLNELKSQVRVSGMTYNQRLETENLGKCIEIEFMLREASLIENGSIIPNKAELDRHAELRRVLFNWAECGGASKEPKVFFDFLCSPQLTNMPFYRIRSCVFAKLTTSDGKVKSGDNMDIDQISAIVPFCDYVICDKTMRNILRGLKIDEDYSAKIIAATDCDILIAELEQL